MRATASILIITCAFLLIVACQPEKTVETPEDLEQLVDKLCQPPRQGLGPGTAVAVVKDGQTLLNKSYGYANLEHKIPITTNARFDLASVSKQFAGYAISKLVEEGKIQMTDNVRKYIPQLYEFDDVITIDHLVHHTSGIRDWTSTLPLSGRTFDDEISFEHILRMAYNQRALNFVPGDQYAYSNTGYNLLAEVVQRVSGQTFREWTRDHIFKPLKMESTLFLDNHREMIPNRVTGYSRSNEAFEPSPNLLTALGSSSMYSTTSDLVKWANFLQEGIKEGDPVVSRMLTQGILNNGEEISYAYGLGIGEFNGSRWITHSGSWASFRTFIALLPAHDLSIIVLCNYSKNVRSIAREIASAYVPQSSEVDEDTEKVAEVTVSKETLDDYVGKYRLGGTWYVDITLKEDKLWTQATDEDNFPMMALSDTLFKVPAYGDRTMTFHKDASGTVTHLVYMNDDRPKMTESFDYSPSMASQYVGRYYSSELNTYLSVQLNGSDLTMWHFDHGQIGLSPVWIDDFKGSNWWIHSVVFARNEEGIVSGFHTSNFRARNQWFEKVE